MSLLILFCATLWAKNICTEFLVRFNGARPIIKVHDSLSHIQDTIATWNPDEVEDNLKCLQRCASNMPCRDDRFISVSDSEGDQNSSSSDSQVRSPLLE